jgi:hypothetical protein
MGGNLFILDEEARILNPRERKKDGERKNLTAAQSCTNNHGRATPLEMPSLDDARDMTVEHFWEPEEIEHAA